MTLYSLWSGEQDMQSWPPPFPSQIYPLLEK